MKILKRVGIAILIAIVVILVISFFLPTTMHIEKSKVIKASPAAVYSQINNLKKWRNWNPFYKMDTTMKITYGGPEEGKGAKYSWESAKQGKGSMWITQSVPNQEIETELDFGDMGNGKAGFKLEPVEGGTKVTWTMDGNTGNNPIHKLAGVVMKGMVGSQFESGLADLDKASAKAQSDMMQQQKTMQTSADSIGAKKDSMTAKM